MFCLAIIVFIFSNTAFRSLELNR